MRPRVLVACAALLLAGGCLHPPGRRVEIGAISVRVTDEATGRPLEGVPVALALQAWRLRGKFLWLVPSIEPIVGSKLVLRARGISGPDGRVDFPSRRLDLPGSEELAGMYLLVNTAIDMTDYRASLALRVKRDVCREEPGKCTGMPDEIDAAIEEMGEELHANSFLYLNPVASYRGVILGRDRIGGKGEDWPRNWGTFRVEWLEPRPELGGTYEVRLPPREGAAPTPP
jgi:hypothetical protein